MKVCGNLSPSGAQSNALGSTGTTGCNDCSVSDAKARFSIGRVTRFYIPLLLQAFSQCLTYPLVAGIVSHGVFGIDAQTAFTQGLMIMFIIGSLGGGLVMTGMVYAKTSEGYSAFKKLNSRMMLALVALQCVFVLPPFHSIVFNDLLSLPPHLSEISRWILLWSAIANCFFFARNVPMVVLLDNLQSAKANAGTLIRVVTTIVLAAIFPRLGLVGPYWGLSVLTFGVFIELFITWYFARPYVKALEKVPPATDDVSVASQFAFTLPLSLGGFLLSLSPFAVAMFVGHTESATDMLAIHYVTCGVVNPVAFGALRMQAVAIEFPPEFPGDRRLLRYAIAAGIVLGFVPLLFTLPSIGDLYFGGFQNVPERLRGTVRFVSGLYVFINVIQAIRGRVEGLAALAKKPYAVMAGQIAYTLALFTVLLSLLMLDVAGWKMAVCAIYFAPIAATVAVYAVLMRGKNS